MLRAKSSQMSREYWEPHRRVKIEPEDIKEEIEEKIVRTEQIKTEPQEIKTEYEEQYIKDEQQDIKEEYIEVKRKPDVDQQPPFLKKAKQEACELPPSVYVKEEADEAVPHDEEMWVQCSDCDSHVKKKNLSRHFRKAHSAKVRPAFYSVSSFVPGKRVTLETVHRKLEEWNPEGEGKKWQQKGVGVGEQGRERLEKKEEEDNKSAAERAAAQARNLSIGRAAEQAASRARHNLTLRAMGGDTKSPDEDLAEDMFSWSPPQSP